MQDERLRPAETGPAVGDSAREMQVLAASRICIEGIDPEIDYSFDASWDQLFSDFY